MVLILYTKFQEKLDSVIYQDYMKKLPAAIQHKVNRYYHWQDAQRSLFGNLLLMEGLKFSGVTNLTLNELSYTQYNRPYFHHIDFNISHSGEFVVCAISKKNRVGIDVEEIKDIPVSDFTEEFSAIEIAAFLRDKSLRSFYKLWTQKEAFLKAIGTGLSIPLNQISVKDNKIIWDEKEWFVHEIELDITYVSHLCTDTPEPGIVLKAVTF